ncbi:MAG: diguanylate cyclase [Deltaproteobacteria bacterium]|nr:diguanylate cyclase [Deltaproteobacteria bacterium]
MGNLIDDGHAVMKKILLVEDNRFFGAMLIRKFAKESDLEIVWAQSLSESRDILASGEHVFFAAILDFNLPDAPRGEVIVEVIAHSIPVLVFTASSDAVVRDKVWSYNVVDYVFKDDAQSLEYLIYLIRRLEKNQQTKVMVVDDSSFFRKVLVDLLETHQFQVLSASDGKAALALFEEHPDIKLVLTDFEMPELTGLELTRKLRQRYRRDELVIIGISAAGDQMVAASFIKNGANDFIVKQTFMTEEFYSRITQNIENVERAQMILEMSIKDHLTGLYNRRYLFEAGIQFFDRARRQKTTIVCAMLDIDHFKRVNDNYGHDVGDLVLRRLGEVLQDNFRTTDIVARFGGEEFCVLAVDLDESGAVKLFERLREKVKHQTFTTAKGENLSVTISIGICTELKDNLEQMIKTADERLYEAKEGGRNRVVAE